MMAFILQQQFMWKVFLDKCKQQSFLCTYFLNYDKGIKNKSVKVNIARINFGGHFW